MFVATDIIDRVSWCDAESGVVVLERRPSHEDVKQ